MNRLFSPMLMGPAQRLNQPMAEMPQQQKRVSPFGNLFNMQDPAMRNLMVAAGTAMASRNPAAFGQTLLGLQQQSRQNRSQKAMGNMTSKWLRSQGRNDLADAVDAGEMSGKDAMAFYKTTKAEKPAERKTLKAADGYQYYVDTGERVFPDAVNQKAEQLKQKQQIRQENKSKNASLVVQDIDRAMQKIEGSKDWGPDFMGINTATGLVGSGLSYIPGTNAHDTSSLIRTVKANAGFDRLQEMRDASPTGGALGQVSNIELLSLQSAIGNLEISQSDDQLIDNLKRVKNIYLDIIHGKDQGPPREQLGFLEQNEETPAATPNNGWEIQEVKPNG